jgi:uncharacterized surface protein with fasciclin (FAS1) repeats
MDSTTFLSLNLNNYLKKIIDNQTSIFEDHFNFLSPKANQRFQKQIQEHIKKLKDEMEKHIKETHKNKFQVLVESILKPNLLNEILNSLTTTFQSLKTLKECQ